MVLVAGNEVPVIVAAAGSFAEDITGIVVASATGSANSFTTLLITAVHIVVAMQMCDLRTH